MRLTDCHNNGRIEAAFVYDSSGNVVEPWKGDPFFTGPEPGRVAPEPSTTLDPRFQCSPDGPQAANICAIDACISNVLM
jgi:hypothetical protein